MSVVPRLLDGSLVYGVDKHGVGHEPAVTVWLFDKVCIHKRVYVVSWGCDHSLSIE